MVCAIRLANDSETNQNQLIKHFLTRTLLPCFPLGQYKKSAVQVRAHESDFDVSAFQTLRDLWSKAPWTLICAESGARVASTAGLRPLVSIASDCLLFSKNISRKGLTRCASSTGAARSAVGLSGARQVAPPPAASARSPRGRQRGDAGIIAACISHTGDSGLGAGSAPSAARHLSQVVRWTLTMELPAV